MKFNIRSSDFFKGICSIFSIRGRTLEDDIFIKDDEEALRKDWDMVGQDLQKVIPKIDNDMTFSKEVISRVFLQYHGQKYYHPCDKGEFMFIGINDDGNPVLWGDWSGGTSGWSGSSWVEWTDVKLILRPISDMTIKEKRKAAELMNFKHEPVINITSFLRDFLNGKPIPFNIHPRYVLELIQYLQFIGIDLPSIFLDGKTLREAGLAIYKKDLK